MKTQTASRDRSGSPYLRHTLSQKCKGEWIQTKWQSDSGEHETCGHCNRSILTDEHCYNLKSGDKSFGLLCDGCWTNARGDKRGTKWLLFWENVVLPLNILSGFVYFVTGVKPVSIIILILTVLALVGLKRRHISGWYINFALLIAITINFPLYIYGKKVHEYELRIENREVLSRLGNADVNDHPLPRPEFTFEDFALPFGMAAIIILLPNAIYFWKRRYLFEESIDSAIYDTKMSPISKPFAVNDHIPLDPNYYTNSVTTEPTAEKTELFMHSDSQPWYWAWVHIVIPASAISSISYMLWLYYEYLTPSIILILSVVTFISHKMRHNLRLWLGVTYSFALCIIVPMTVYYSEISDYRYAVFESAYLEEILYPDYRATVASALLLISVLLIPSLFLLREAQVAKEKHKNMP